MHEHMALLLFRKESKTCSKGFELKVATLRLKNPLKMKDYFIGNKTITKVTKTNAEPSRAKLSKAEPS